MKTPKAAQRYFIKVIYQGNKYHGWQSQPDERTLQEVIEEGIAQIYRATPIVGSGRTDRGVHAWGQVAHLDLGKEVEPTLFLRQLNAVLPASIYVADMKKVRPEAHARFNAVRRSYAYYIRQTPNPFARETSYYYPYALNVRRMNETAKVLVGRLDATSFCKRKSSLEDSFCQVYEANWREEQDCLVFRISANRFLHHMVRTIVGTLLKLEQNEGGQKEFLEIIGKKDRRAAGANVPPHGLFLLEVSYPDAVYF